MRPLLAIVLSTLLATLPRFGAQAMSLLPHWGVTPADQGETPFVPPAKEMAELVLIKKGMRRLYLIRNGRPIRSYEISLGFSPKGHKRRQGDGRTPEGRYVLDWKNAASGFHLSLHVSYPSTSDAWRARFRGEPAGGMIMIHGQPNTRKGKPTLTEDWTQGCVAVSNEAIEEIWRLVAPGTPIEILP